MTQRPPFAAFLRNHRARRAGTLLTGLLALAMTVPATAASPEPSPSGEPTGPSLTAEPSTVPAPTPTLTFAPLVTLPPVVLPADPTPVDLADGYSLGAADAPVTMEVWEDFQCPYCRRWTAQVEPAVIDAFIRTGQVRLTYRPLAFLGEESRWAAVAADLAAEQGLFWPLHDLLYANQLGENVGSFGLDRILVMAQAAGLDMDVFMEGLTLDNARERFAALEARSRTDATTLGINATPSVVVAGRLLATPDFDAISAAVQAALAAASPAAASPAAASPAP